MHRVCVLGRWCRQCLVYVVLNMIAHISSNLKYRDVTLTQRLLIETKKVAPFGREE